MNRFRFFANGLFILLIITFSHTVVAQEGSVAVSPAFTEVTLEKPLQRKEIEFTYVNKSNSTIELEIGVIDIKQKDNGVIQYIGQEVGSYSYSLASFLRPEASTVVLESGEEKKFQVGVQNREDLSPGGHYAAVIAKLKNASKTRNGARVEPSLSALVLLRKTGGERFNLSLISSNWPQETVTFAVPRSIELTFQNEGNVHLIPYGVVEVHDFLGRKTYKGVLNVSSLRVFPETRRGITADLIPIDWHLPISINSFTVKGNDSLEKVQFNYKSTFVYIDPVTSSFVVLGILIVWILIKKRKKSRKK